MVTIRLARVGRKNDPSFRLIATDKRNRPSTGRAIEVLGSYFVKTGAFACEKERVLHFVKNGAKLSETAKRLLEKEGVLPKTPFGKEKKRAPKKEKKK